MQISNELLNEVLNKDTLEVISLKGNMLEYSECISNDNKYINIYELGNKCKEWVRNNDKGSTFIHSGLDENAFCGLSFGLKSRFRIGRKEFYADTEPEAIFKACQWVLENLGERHGNIR